MPNHGSACSVPKSYTQLVSRELDTLSSNVASVGGPGANESRLDQYTSAKASDVVAAPPASPPLGLQAQMLPRIPEPLMLLCWAGPREGTKDFRLPGVIHVIYPFTDEPPT